MSLLHALHVGASGALRPDHRCEWVASGEEAELQQIEVTHSGNEQQPRWLTIRRWKPDYVVLRGWGVMNPVALKSAQKVGFPVDHIVGNVWSTSEEDVIPAGDAAKGYTAITTLLQ